MPAVHKAQRKALLQLRHNCLEIRRSPLCPVDVVFFKFGRHIQTGYEATVPQITACRRGASCHIAALAEHSRAWEHTVQGVSAPADSDENLALALMSVRRRAWSLVSEWCCRTASRRVVRSAA